jgi:hypothetical protein
LQNAGDSRVTFPVTALSPPILYNRSQAGEQEKDTMILLGFLRRPMDGKTADNRSRRLAAALVAAAVVAVLAVAFGVHTQTSFATGSGPAGSAAYRQEIAFVRCMRSHGVPSLPDPPPGASISVRLTHDGTGGKSGGPVPQAFAACKQLAPRGRETTDIQITL